MNNNTLKTPSNNWKEKPIAISNWNYSICDYVMFIDENNDNALVEKVRDAMMCGGTITSDERFFTITGCIFKQSDYAKAKIKFDSLKRKYWNNGEWTHPKTNVTKTVCFHSSEIRNRKYAFKNIEHYEEFLNDLSNNMEQIDYKIISISIDLVAYVFCTSYTNDVYDIAFDFILERFLYEIKNKKGMIMLESRGKLEDKKLLKHITEKLENGFKFINRTKIEKNIVGIYFNTKYNLKTNKPITGLEIADLSSYPIHKYVKYDTKDQAFEILEKKLRNYPQYIGRGLKVYPYVNESKNSDITFENIIPNEYLEDNEKKIDKQEI